MSKSLPRKVIDSSGCWLCEFEITEATSPVYKVLDKKLCYNCHATYLMMTDKYKRLGRYRSPIQVLYFAKSIYDEAWANTMNLVDKSVYNMLEEGDKDFLKGLSEGEKEKIRSYFETIDKRE